MEISGWIYENSFDVSFSSFKGLKESEYDLLREFFKGINKDYMVFNLVEINKKVQPLEIILKIISNKLVGNLNIDLHNKDHEVLGKINFKNIVFKSIDGLIEFNFTSENKNKELKVIFEYDDIIYTGKNGKEDKI